MSLAQVGQYFALLCDELCVRRIVQRNEGGLAQALLAPDNQAAVLQFPEDSRGALTAAMEFGLRLLQGEVQPDRAVRLDVAVLPGNAGHNPTDISLPFFKYQRRKNVPAFEKAGTSRSADIGI